MKDKLLIVGGYGQVGTYVSLELVKYFPEKVIIAGRDYEKAKAFSENYDKTLIPLKLDIYNTADLADKMINVKVVVMCLSPKNTDFAEYCIENGIHYVDISPSNNIANNIEIFNRKAQLNNVTCVLGVGIAPGLSNLMVKKLNQSMDYLTNVDTFLLLGVGESHGVDGIRWLLDNIKNDFTIIENGERRCVKTFKDKKKTTFPDPLGLRTAYRFNLADQFIIPKTLNIKNAASYFSYDSKFVTKEVNILKRFGIFNLLKFKLVYNFMVNLFKFILFLSKKIKLGTDIYSIKVDAIGAKDNKKYLCHASVIGNDNSSITGRITAYVAQTLYNKSLKYGVYYIEELFSLDDFQETYNINLDIKIEEID